MVIGTVLPFSDYLQLPPAELYVRDYEMIWGELYVSPQPRFKHQRVQAKIVHLLTAHVEAQDLGVITEPINLYRDEVNYVHPDISYFTSEQAKVLEDETIVRIAPLLVVELLSGSTEGKDRGEKRRWYTDMGVREYWLVDLDAETVEVIDLLTATVRRTDPVRSHVLPGLVLPLARIFG